MRHARCWAGFTMLEMLVVVLIVALLLAVALPVIGKARGDAGVQGSMANLVTLDVAHVLYAADWNGRQVTFARDDLAAFGDNVGDYNDAHGGCCCFGCHPPILAGWGCDGYLHGYWMHSSNGWWAVEPINFPGGPNGDTIAGFGNFRITNAKPLHEYVNGRYQEATFYPPNDSVVLATLENCLNTPCEYDGGFRCNPGWSSYDLSPAAFFHPDVMRANAEGGWQDPWSIDHGFESPGLFQAQYPDLKTHMIEHHWVQGPPAECNPNIDLPFQPYGDCEPYYFNHGIDSTPVTLFYDGHVRLLPNTEVFAADQQILKQTGGVDGLWHRGTPFGEDGYYISAGYDGVPLSHHILTTDGILGRDTLAETPPNPLAASWNRIRPTGEDELRSALHPDISFNLMVTTSEGDQP
ncbi:MAG: prepilin-type N-terminal cleavage/methylation domain-containing protein [Planctomycetes bacterium]|nr:prepilin-type N-terminal cleavage/methylation domain-containing protein [Planctomycetota bacterium]